jgi:hypothetical protein
VTTVAVIWAPGESPVLSIFACIPEILKVWLPLRTAGENVKVTLFPVLLATGATVKPSSEAIRAPTETTVAVPGESDTEMLDDAEIGEQNREIVPMTLELPPTENELPSTEQLCAKAVGPSAKPRRIAIDDKNAARLNWPICVVTQWWRINSRSP